jgi:hypothetical protein
VTAAAGASEAGDRAFVVSSGRMVTETIVSIGISAGILWGAIVGRGSGLGRLGIAALALLSLNQVRLLLKSARRVTLHGGEVTVAFWTKASIRWSRSELHVSPKTIASELTGFRPVTDLNGVEQFSAWHFMDDFPSFVKMFEGDDRDPRATQGRSDKPSWWSRNIL